MKKAIKKEEGESSDSIPVLNLCETCGGTGLERAGFKLSPLCPICKGSGRSFN